MPTLFVPVPERAPRTKNPSSVLPIRGIVLLAIALLSLALHAGETNALAKFQNVHRIVFLGDSITYAGQYVDDIEAYYITRFPEQHLEFINVGLPSETVSGLSEPGHAGGKFPRPDLHERLGRVLEKTKPDLAFACYGMNDGIYQPFYEARFKAFREGMQWLHQQVTNTGARTIHITPPVFDARAFGRTNSSYNEVLDRYSDWLLAQRKTGWDVADLHGAMNRWLAEERKSDTNFNFTKDGIHPDAHGHWIMAKQILLHLGAADIANANGPAEMVAANPHGAEILKLVHDKQQLLRNAWLNFTGFKRPGIAGGLPVPEAENKAGVIDRQIRELTSRKP